MSARLSTAIRIGEAAKAIFRKTQSFPSREFGEHADLSEREHVGVEPMLLALSMELALKAWFVFDHDDPRVVKSHNLMKLFDRLKPESQEKLDAEFKRSVLPTIPMVSISTTAFATFCISTKMPLPTGATFTRRRNR
ncbi:hypothetical protein [Mesorhizobium sp. M7A.F.Ca.MR.148.00.0.0]|uniref:hypothetical protein n=1 Tax=Mesorhizobium sp. M7A.F.Ca.MR.148.00.0.0 TaxID=2496775 RepID=UPI001FDF4C6B|nr:hypothetical protein [Mesorhizobium sp. M7A.F.Ca.MR.148.00.0.0]